MRLLRPWWQQEHKRRVISLIALAYVPIALLSVNILIIKDPILGVLFTFAFFMTNIYLLYPSLQNFFNQEKITTSICCASIILFGIAVILSPLMIIETLRSVHVVTALSISVVPIILYRLWNEYGLSLSNSIEINQTHKPKIVASKLQVTLTVAVVTLLISDIAILTEPDVTGPGLISEVIPYSHFYIIAVATGILLYLIFSSLSAGIKVGLILFHSIVLHLVWSFVVPLPIGVDPWSLIGDVNATLLGNERYSITSLFNPDSTEETIQIGYLELPSWIVLRLGSAIPYTVALVFQQLTQINMVQLSPWLGPIIYAIAGRAFLFQIGRALSLKENYSLVLMMSGSFFPLFIIFGNETLKLTLVLPLFLLGVYVLIRYAVNKERKFLLASIVVTAVGALSYSLFFVVLMQILIMVLSVSKTAYAKRKAIRVLVPVAISLVLILAIPLVDTIYKTNFDTMIPDPIIMYKSIQDFSFKIGGLDGQIFSHRELFEDINLFGFAIGNWWIYTNIFLWGMIGVGLVNRSLFITRNIHCLFLWFFIITHISLFIAETLLVGQRPLSAHLTQIAEISRFPFLAAGLYSVISFLKMKMSDKSNFRLENLITTQLAIMGIIVISSFTLIAANAVEIRTYWTGLTDIDASAYIIRNAYDDNSAEWTSFIEGTGILTTEIDSTNYKVGESSIKSTFLLWRNSEFNLRYDPKTSLDLSKRQTLEFWIQLEEKARIDNNFKHIQVTVADNNGNILQSEFTQPMQQWSKIRLDYSNLAKYSTFVELDQIDYINISGKSDGLAPISVRVDSVDPAGDFILITQDLATWPLYGLSGGKKLMGGFNDEPSLGTSPATKTSTLYWDLRSSPSSEKLESIARDANVCTVFVEIPSYSLPDDGRLAGVMGDPVSFTAADYRGTQSTIVYQSRLC